MSKGTSELSSKWLRQDRNLRSGSSLEAFGIQAMVSFPSHACDSFFPKASGGVCITGAWRSLHHGSPEEQRLLWLLPKQRLPSIPGAQLTSELTTQSITTQREPESSCALVHLRETGEASQSR